MLLLYKAWLRKHMSRWFVLHSIADKSQYLTLVNRQAGCYQRNEVRFIPPHLMPLKPISRRLIAAQEENVLLRERIKHLELALHSVQEDAVAHKTRASSISKSEPLGSSPSNTRELSSFDRSPDSDKESPGVDGEDADPLDALGNLTLGEEGASTFHGTLAHTEVIGTYSSILDVLLIDHCDYLQYLLKAKVQFFACRSSRQSHTI